MDIRHFASFLSNRCVRTFATVIGERLHRRKPTTNSTLASFSIKNPTLVFAYRHLLLCTFTSRSVNTAPSFTATCFTRSGSVSERNGVRLINVLKLNTISTWVAQSENTLGHELKSEVNGRTSLLAFSGERKVGDLRCEARCRGCFPQGALAWEPAGRSDDRANYCLNCRFLT